MGVVEFPHRRLPPRLLTAVLSLPRGHFAMETALEQPRLLQRELPTGRFERRSRTEAI